MTVQQTIDRLEANIAHEEDRVRSAIAEGQNAFVINSHRAVIRDYQKHLAKYRGQ